jgi:hypothetical protein
LAIVALGLADGPARATNLLTNGDFSAGNTGFTSAYTYVPFIDSETQYTVVAANRINDVNIYGDSTDPTGANGNVLLANSAIILGLTVWSETVPVTPNTSYEFSLFAGDVNSAFPRSDAILEPSINGQIEPPLHTGPEWVEWHMPWNSGTSTTATLVLFDLNTAAGGNDFAVDDLTFGPGIPEASTWIMALIGFAWIGYRARQGFLTTSRATPASS